MNRVFISDKLVNNGKNLNCDVYLLLIIVFIIMFSENSVNNVLLIKLFMVSFVVI